MHLLASQIAAFAAIAAPLAVAQTFTSCNPTEKSCPNVAGLSTSSYSVDLSSGVPQDWSMTSGSLKTSPSGGLFQINSVKDGPTIASDFSIFFGSVEVTMQAAPGAGIVSTFVMESIDLDEIDLEIIGSETTQVQSNYFGKGNTSSYDRGQYHPVNSPQTAFHTYKVDWKPESTEWYIDGQLVRTLNFADAVGGKNYPQTPVNIRIGNWVAGQAGNAAGTIQWAGGLADMTKAPFNMYVTKINIENYNPCAEYEYSDKTGDWQSIKCASNTTSSSTTSASAATSAGTTGKTSTGSKTIASPVPSTTEGTGSASSAPASSAPASSSTPDSPVTTSSVPVSIPETQTTVLVTKSVTTCPVGHTVTSGSITSTLATPSVSTIYLTTVSTICTKCTKNHHSTPAPPMSTPVPVESTVTVSPSAPPAPPAGSSPAAPPAESSPAPPPAVSSPVPPAGTGPVPPPAASGPPLPPTYSNGSVPLPSPPPGAGSPPPANSPPAPAASSDTAVSPIDTTASPSAVLTFSATNSPEASVPATSPTAAPTAPFIVPSSYVGGTGSPTIIAPSGSLAVSPITAAPTPSQFTGAASRQNVNVLAGLIVVAGLLLAL